MFAATLLALVPVLPPVFPPVAMPVAPVAAPQRKGGGWGLIPFPGGGYTGTRRPFPTTRGLGRKKPPPPPPPPRGTGGYDGPGDTTRAPGKPATRRAAPLTPAMTPGSTTSTTQPVEAVTAGPLPALMDLDEWSLWWLLHHEGYVTVEPWRLGATGSDGFFLGRGQVDEANLGGLSDASIYGRIVPALVHALEDDPSEALRTGALLSLARIGAKADTTPSSAELLAKFIENLDDKNLRIAETACISLGIFGDPRSLGLLSDLLLNTEVGRESLGRHDVPRRVRAFAAYGIGLLAQNAELEVRASATQALFSALAEKPGAMPDERIAALVALSMIDPTGLSNEESVTRLLDLLDEDNENVSTRAHVPAGLATLAPFLEEEMREKVLDELLDTASRSTERDLIRAGCVIALGRLGDADEDKLDEKIRKKLMKLASAGSYRERTFALISLAQIGARAGVGKGDPREGAEDVRKFFLKRLARAKSRDRPWYALALGVLARGIRDAGDVPSTDALDELRDALGDAKSPNETVAFAVALGLSGDADAVEDLAEELVELEPAMRGDVALALGMTGSPAAIAILEESLAKAKHEPHALQNTARALALLRAPNVVPAIQALGEECDCALSNQGIALALGRSRHPDAASPLLTLLEGDESSTLERAYAALGLGYLADKDTTAWSYRIAEAVHYRAYASTLTGANQSGILDLP